MKRRILLLMMTALLSVGAWAQSLWTKTLWTGSQTVTSSAPLTIAKSELQGARVGSQICIYLDLSVTGGQWGDNIIYYNSGWCAVSMNPGTGIVAKGLLDATIVNGSDGLTIKPQNDYSTCTVTRVTLNYNGANLLSDAEGYNPGWYGTQLNCSNASEGDVLAVAIKANSVSYSWGTANGKLYLQSALGNPDATDDTDLYTGNGALTGSGVTIAGSVFSEIVVGDKLAFSGTGEGDGKTITVTSNDVELDNNPYWYTVTIEVTSSNIETIQTYGVVVTGAVGTLAKVTKQSIPEGRPTGYISREDFSENATLYIPLTSELASYAQANSLYIGGSGYTATSVDLIYQPSAVNIGSTGYATFGYPFAVDLSGLGASQDAYTVTVSGTKALLTSVKGKKIPANTGIILEGTDGDAISLPLTTETTDNITDNDLLVSDGTVKGDESGTIYVLAYGTSGVGFYLVENGSAITAGKAYLEVSGGAARQFIGFGDDNETTGIQTVANSQQSAANSYYDLQGRRVAQPTKGLYIVNGKKVIIK